MKNFRYLIFYGDSYYPAGGWNDFNGAFESLDEAKEHLLTVSKNWDWAEIVDTETLTSVWNKVK